MNVVLYKRQKFYKIYVHNNNFPFIRLLHRINYIIKIVITNFTTYAVIIIISRTTLLINGNIWMNTGYQVMYKFETC